MVEGARYWVLDSPNESNKITEASEATGMNLVGIVDEQGGGVIAYVFADDADKIAAALNSSHL